MALNFKIYKSNAKNGTKDKFYARASHKDTVSMTAARCCHAEQLHREALRHRGRAL